MRISSKMIWMWSRSHDDSPPLIPAQLAANCRNSPDALPGSPECPLY
ncbi:MAG: hypothetical protein WB676_24805 [Bryobacteraceae bacterium]